MPQLMHVSLFSVRHLFFGSIWIYQSIQFMTDGPPPHSITLYSSRRTMIMYIGLQKAIWYIRLVRYIDLYPNLQQMPPPPHSVTLNAILGHLLSHLSQNGGVCLQQIGGKYSCFSMTILK